MKLLLAIVLLECIFWRVSPFLIKSNEIFVVVSSCDATKRHNVEDFAVSSTRRKAENSPFCQNDTMANFESRHHRAVMSRRTIVSGLLGLISLPITDLRAGIAAEPVQAKDTDSLLMIAKRKLRPKPPKLLRRKLSLDFAVLLMRSSYNALDELDCVAMDQFQRDFFLIRSSEYETYTNALGNGLVQQGDLTDPYYFDFISFAQYKTINRELTQNPPSVFEEMQLASDSPLEDESSVPATFVPVVVKRDPSLTNAMLVPTHSSKVGARILDRLEENFDQSESRIPKVGKNPDCGT
jgi:hypothetical protein